jgi:hypothetical protein
MAKILKLLCGLLIIFTFAGCSAQKDAAVKETKPKKVEAEVVKPQEEQPAQPEQAAEPAQPSIDTSVFQYAKSVDVDDSRDIMQHINLVVNMSEDITAALATTHVFTQTYDFLQQKDIAGANTVTIGIMKGDIRVAQITVDVKKFKAGENYIQSVLQASKIDKMSSEVKEYGKSAGYW